MKEQGRAGWKTIRMGYRLGILSDSRISNKQEQAPHSRTDEIYFFSKKFYPQPTTPPFKILHAVCACPTFPCTHFGKFVHKWWRMAHPMCLNGNRKTHSLLISFIFLFFTCLFLAHAFCKPSCCVSCGWPKDAIATMAILWFLGCTLEFTKCSYGVFYISHHTIELSFDHSLWNFIQCSYMNVI